MRPLSPAWIRPTSVDPALLVDREADLAKYLRILTDYAVDEEPNALVLLRGDRGVGKSIFARRLVTELKERLPQRVIPVVLDHRGSDEVHVLRRFIELFVQTAPAVVDGLPELRRDWLTPLQQLFAGGNRMVLSVGEGTGREVGATGELSGGLWGVLQGKFGAAWKSKIDLTRRTDYTIEINEDLLRAAIVAALEAVAGHAAVVVFFDDLDQARRMGSPEEAKGTLRGILDLRPCLKIVHLRSEYGYADWRREVDLTIDLDGLPGSELVRMLRRRAEREGSHREVLADPTSWEPLERLATATDNPHVLLRWVQALATEGESWPPAPGWHASGRLERLVLRSLNGPDPETELLARLGRVLERLGRSRGFDEADLQRGCSKVDPGPAPDCLDAAEIAWLRQYELLLPVNREDPAAGLRADPLLDLLRPSVSGRLTR